MIINQKSKLDFNLNDLFRRGILTKFYFNKKLKEKI